MVRELKAKRIASKEFLCTRPRSFRPGWSYRASPRHEENLVGVGVGPRIQGGIETSTPAVRFYVARKIKDVPDSLRFPPAIDGVPTDVIEVGHILPACNPVPGPIGGEFRPLKPGCSISKEGDLPGTMGAVVTKQGKHFLLTNNHVIADDNQSAIGQPVFQPDPSSSQPNPGRVARVSEFVPLGGTGVRHVDAAIAELEITASPIVLLNDGHLASTDPVEAHRGMKVHKVGRTTGLTCGIVDDVVFDYWCSYTFGDVKMEDQILIKSADNSLFGFAGDSGSLIVDEDSSRATGLLFAVDFNGLFFAVANHAHKVLAELKVTLVI